MSNNKIKSVKTKVNEYNDLCENCKTPNLCLDYGVFSECLKKSKKKCSKK